MTATPAVQPAWPLAVMALFQAFVGSTFLTSMKEPGGSWNLEYALLGIPFTILSVVVLGFAVRNCVRLWRVEAWEASWGLVCALAVTAIFSLLVATGPMSIGRWEWESLIFMALGLFLATALVRETRRRIAKKSQLEVTETTQPGRLHN